MRLLMPMPITSGPGLSELMVSTISSDKPGPLVIGIGISKRKATHQGAGGMLTEDIGSGRVS